MFLTTRVAEQDGCVVVGVEGELDMSTADQLLDALVAASARRPVDIVLDLADLRFCDSAGLAVFVKTHNGLEASGHRLVVARPAPEVARILDLSGLSQVIPMSDDLVEACVTATSR